MNNFISAGKGFFPSQMLVLASLAGLFAQIPFIFASAGPGGGGYIDPRFKRILWYLIGSTKGGVNRAKIIGLSIPILQTPTR